MKRKFYKLKLRPCTIWLAVLPVLIFSSCYSVRISNKPGTGDPDPLNMEKGYYRGLKVNVIDTTINLSLLANEVLMLESCPQGGFHTFEYRVTLGDVLLSGITLGKKRRVHVKYVCLKESF
jgi:hypothetical protein